jgi:hypothetical protein
MSVCCRGNHLGDLNCSERSYFPPAVVPICTAFCHPIKGFRTLPCNLDDAGSGAEAPDRYRFLPVGNITCALSQYLYGRHLYYFRGTGWLYNFMIQKTPKGADCSRRVAPPLGKTTYLSYYLVEGSRCFCREVHACTVRHFV